MQRVKQLSNLEVIEIGITLAEITSERKSHTAHLMQMKLCIINLIEKSFSILLFYLSSRTQLTSFQANEAIV